MSNRCVSPSLRAAARLDGERVHGESSFKLAAQVAMATLDSLADDEQLTSMAYNSMAKRLKLVYDSRDTALRRAKGKVVVRMAAESPLVLMHAPVDVEWVTPYFVRSILCERAETGVVDDSFLQELVEAFLGDPYMDLPSFHVRNGLMSLLEGDAELLGPHIVTFLVGELSYRNSSDIFELYCPKCSSPVLNRRQGMMVLASEFYPDKSFYEWLVAGVDTNLYPTLAEALRSAAGIKEEPLPICTSPSLCG